MSKISARTAFPRDRVRRRPRPIGSALASRLLALCLVLFSSSALAQQIHPSCSSDPGVYTPLVPAATPPLPPVAHLYPRPPSQLGPNESPSNPRMPGGVPSSGSLNLYLDPGAIASDTPAETVCENGSGEEVCGVTLVLQATGDLSFLDFCEQECAPGLVVAPESRPFPSGTKTLRINLVGTVIDAVQDSFFIGDISLSTGTDYGEIVVDPTSQAAGARLQLLTPHDNGPLAISCPEPAAALGLAIGTLGLALGARRRTRPQSATEPRRHSTLAPPPAATGRRRASRALGLLASLALATPSGAAVFTDEAAFVAAVGGSPSRVGFESVPLSGAGFAAATNGDRIAQITLSSPSVDSNVNLAWDIGVPLGLLGTMLIADPGLASGDPALWPGGTGSANGPLRNDDLRIEFDGPVSAAGLTILENVTQVGESVTFLDGDDQPIASFALPGGATPPGADGFIGYVIEPGDAAIAAIEIDEQMALSDEIGVDEILYDRGADPFADLAPAFTVGGGPPSAPNLDEDQSLGPPDASTVSLGSGGKLLVRFVDNSLTGSGNALADLRIYEDGESVEGPAFPESGTVEISPNGSLWYSVGSFAGGVSEIDIDAFGFDETDEFFFVRLIDDFDQGPSSGPTAGADIDAVEALSGRLLPPDSDDDGVPDSYDDCVNDYDASQRDDDGDGFGNACDNCRDVPNPDQDDTDKDGQGDACEPARLRLVRDFAKTPLPPGEFFGLADLRLDCGGFPITTVMTGVWIPPGVDRVVVGNGCQAPPNNAAAPSAPNGPGCGPGTNVGASVAPGLSGAFGIPMNIPGQLPPLGSRSDVVWVLLEGNPTLCTPGQTNVFLARLKTEDANGNQQGVAAYSFENIIDEGWCLAEGSGGSCLDDSVLHSTQTSLAVPPMTPIAELLLRPAWEEGLPPTPEWDIYVGASTAFEMHRVTLGLLGPELATESSLFLGGCTDFLEDPNSDLDRRNCPDQVGPLDDVLDVVDETFTFTLGPYSDPVNEPPEISTVLAETLYTPIEGGLPGSSGVSVLNPLPEDSPIGTITNDLPATTGAPPIVMRNGFELIDNEQFHDSPSAPFQTVETAQETDLDGQFVYETILFNAGHDFDLDGHEDPIDNCPFVANLDQSDVGGFQQTGTADGRGDLCECGDANQSGAVVGPGGEGALEPDLQLLREYLVGLRDSDTHIPTICSVDGDTDCDIVDAVVLERAFRGLATIEQRCDAAVD